MHGFVNIGNGHIMLPVFRKYPTRSWAEKVYRYTNQKNYCWKHVCKSGNMFPVMEAKNQSLIHVRCRGQEKGRK
jgi:hypothetical protein